MEDFIFGRGFLQYQDFEPPSSRKKLHYTIGDKLDILDILKENELRTMSIGDVILDGDIGWLASGCASGKEIEIIYSNQTEIENELGNPSLRVLVTDKTYAKRLEKTLEKYNISNPRDLANKIIKEAKFWYEKLGK